MTFFAAYRMTVFANRTIDPTEAAILTPIAGAAHSDQFKVTTLPSLAGWKPYLGFPTGRRGRIDLLSKKTDTGEVSIGILDYRVGAVSDNLTRWMTAFLGDVKGANRLGLCKALVEESLDGGVTWSAFFTGRILSCKLRGALQYDVQLRDMAEDMNVDIFVGKPTPAVYMTGSSPGDGKYAQLVSVHPIGFVYPYGTVPVTPKMKGTIEQLNSTLKTAHIRLTNTSQAQPEAILIAQFVNALKGGLNTGFGGFADLPAGSNPSANASIQPNFNNPARLHLKRLDTQAEGDFRVGLGFTQTGGATAISMVNHILNGGTIRVRGIWALCIAPLECPRGVATGAPKANGAQGSGGSTVNTKGWTISITGILKEGDVFSFSGHLQRYQVTADANSDGSGNSTVSITPPLQAAIADNEVITVQTSAGRMDLPPNTTPVEFSVVVDAKVEDSNPVLITDVHPVKLWKDILDGNFGLVWRESDGVTNYGLPPGKNYGDPKRVFAYDATAFTNLINDASIPTIRAIISSRMKMNEFIEKYICKPNSLGYYLNGAGQVVPVDLRLPVSTGGLPTITDADLVDKEDPAWEHSAAAAVTVARGKRYVEMFTQPVVQRLQIGDQFPIITNKMFESAASEVIDPSLGNPALGEKFFEVDAIGLRNMPGEQLNGQDRGLYNESVLRRYMMEPNRSFGNGPMTVQLKLRRTANTNGILPGVKTIATISKLPDPATNKRGGTRLLICSERIEDNATVKCTFVDSGLALISNSPVFPSVIGVPAQYPGDTKHGAIVVVQPNAQSEAFEVWYAITDTATGVRPVDTSALWTPIPGKWFTQRTVSVRNLPANSRVWFRARTLPMIHIHVLGLDLNLPVLKLPSAWAYALAPGYVDLGTLSAPSAPAVATFTGSTGDLTFTIGDATLQTVVGLSSPVGDPTTPVATLLPGQNRLRLTGLAVSTTYRVSVWHIDGAGGKSAVVTVDFTTSATKPTAPNFRLVSV